VFTTRRYTNPRLPLPYLTLPYLTRCQNYIADTEEYLFTSLIYTAEI